MRIATWNVNSINARLETVLGWFEEAAPDVACLQEIKCVDEKFPTEAFERLGYNVAVHGQKTYNGVALLSKTPLEDVRRGLPDGDGWSDDHARYIEAVISGPMPVRVAAIYLPNGNPIGTEKFAYKLRWMERLNAHARDLLALEEPLVSGRRLQRHPRARRRRQSRRLGGRRPLPAGEPRRLPRAEVARPDRRLHGRRRRGRTATPSGTIRPGPGTRNHGIRIDHLLLSPQAADRLDSVVIHREVRGREKPSDHVPVVAEIRT